MKKTIMILAAALITSSMAFAQLRPTDQTGVNVFENTKTSEPFTGPSVKFGGSFALPYMALQQSNNITDPTSSSYLYQNGSNFALSMADLFINSYLADGVTLQVTMYLASKHHHEAWVKGGFIQFDKLPFLKSDLLDNIMKYTTIKVGQMDVNYGDAHFRRSDGGCAIYNTFMENYIMDEFATEIGGEADVNYNGIVGVLAVTNGELNPDLSTSKHDPSLIVKLGYDKQLTDAFRLRLTGSMYSNAGTVHNTLFGGDRTGSNYSGVTYNVGPGTSSAFDGRYNPGFTYKLNTFMGNLFLKYKIADGVSAEAFTTIEHATGAESATAADRTATQFAQDLIFRFGPKENFFLGARYDNLATQLKGSMDNVNINRVAVSGGWYMTKNIMAKVEYVNQKYTGFTAGSIQDGLEFHGLSAEAVVSF